MLQPHHGGGGEAREAAAALVQVAFGHLGRHRVVAQPDPRSRASATPCRAPGMGQEADVREQSWFTGEWGDLLVVAVLRSECGPPAGSTGSGQH